MICIAQYKVDTMYIIYTDIYIMVTNYVPMQISTNQVHTSPTEDLYLKSLCLLGIIEQVLYPISLYTNQQP